MHLDKEQQDRILNHLNKALKKSLKCPVCENVNWGITNELFELHGLHKDDITMDSVPIAPTIILTCKNCGNILLFDANLVGAIDSPKNKKYQP